MSLPLWAPAPPTSLLAQPPVVASLSGCKHSGGAVSRCREGSPILFFMSLMFFSLVYSYSRVCKTRQRTLPP